MNNLDITLFTAVAYIIGFILSLAIFYTINMVSHEDFLEEENIDLFTAIFLSLFSWICILLLLLFLFASIAEYVFKKLKLKEKYKALNERFMHKKRDKKDG